MLDKANGKSVEKVGADMELEEAREPKAVETASEKAEPKAAEAETFEEPMAAKESGKLEAVEDPVAAEPEVPRAAEAAPVKEEPAKIGYHSELDGIAVEYELQYRDQETDMEDISKRVREDYVRRGNDASAIELIQVYLKPTDYTAYYVINNSYEGKIPLF